MAGFLASETSATGTSPAAGNMLVIEPASEAWAWAMYCYTPPATDYVTGLELEMHELSGGYWLGLANYAADCWEWRGPYSQELTQEIALPADTSAYLSPAGSLAWLVLVEAGSRARVAWSKVTADRITYIDVTDIGRIAVRVNEPATARFPMASAPVVVNMGAFLMEPEGFTVPLPVQDVGCVQVSYLWPGLSDSRTGAASAGDFDYGGEDCLVALRDVLKFACGTLTDVDGNTIGDLCTHTVDTANVGMYGFSHPGIMAINVMAMYGAELTGVSYFVGGENPTEPAVIAKELGYWDADDNAVLNDYYEYPADYAADKLNVFLDPLRWEITTEYPAGRPYWTSHTDYRFYTADSIPTIFGDRAYSPELICELIDNGELDVGDWPSGVGNPLEVCFGWEERSTIGYNPILGYYWNHFDLLAANTPDFKVMLVFAARDHVQPLPDKPHIHQAWDGCRDNGLWVRLNPDRAYVVAIDSAFDNSVFPDNAANDEPVDWLNIENWAYPNIFAGSETKTKISLAAVAEMADRVRFNDWSENLAAVLN
ncbi:hypothetical protein JW859_10645 [bacterium]|nr:hypothetical protein [bacterium]